MPELIRTPTAQGSWLCCYVLPTHMRVLDAWEQVRDDAIKQGQVVSQKLGHVDIMQRP